MAKKHTMSALIGENKKGLRSRLRKNVCGRPGMGGTGVTTWGGGRSRTGSNLLSLRPAGGKSAEKT